MMLIFTLTPAFATLMLSLMPPPFSPRAAADCCYFFFFAMLPYHISCYLITPLLAVAAFAVSLAATL